MMQTWSEQLEWCTEVDSARRSSDRCNSQSRMIIVVYWYSNNRQCHCFIQSSLYSHHQFAQGQN